MKSILKALAGAAVVATMATGVNAATFNFADADRNSSSSFSMTDASGLSVTVSGGVYDGGTKSVKTNKGFGLSVGSHLVDTNEYALFKFSHDVMLDSFKAGYVDKYDDYRIYAYVGGEYIKIQTGDFGRSNSNGYNKHRTTINTVGSAAGVSSHLFAIGVDDGWDDFKIRKLSAHKVPEVPLPAGAVLLLSGLGVLALRRKKS